MKMREIILIEKLVEMQRESFGLGGICKSLMIRKRKRKKVGKCASWVYIIQLACTRHPVFEEENDISSFEPMFFNKY